jgi:23S rRNA pseudouridine2605 synthase
MGKFNKKSGSEGGRGRSKDGEKSKTGGYKAKRSFSKNKSYRENNKGRSFEKPYRSFKKSESSEGSETRERTSKPLNKDFSKDKYSDRPQKTYRNSEERKPFKKDFDRDRDKKFDRPRRDKDSSEERRPSRDDSKPKRDFDRDRKFDRPRRDKDSSEERRPSRDDSKPKRDFDRDRKFDGPRRDRDNSEERRPSRDDSKPKRDFDRDRKFDGPRRDRDSSEERRPSRDDSKPKRSFDNETEGKSYKKAYKKKDDKFSGFKKANKKEGFRRDDDIRPPKKKRFSKPRKFAEESEKRVKHDDFEQGKAFSKPSYKEEFGNRKEFKKPKADKTSPDGLIRLNKYLSNAGVASRREADNLIVSGAVKVNGIVVNQLGTKIKATDTVTFGDSAVRTERKVYLLLNKPKDYITTTDDPQERKTVMELIAGACRERIYPVGRLDRNTTGLLLFTNDGDLAKKLTHPKHDIKKVYHVSLNKGLKPDDFKSIIDGIELEDGLANADDLAFVGEGKKEVGIEIHSGRNRIVRRIFEHLGYDVLKLDRVVFAGLTKKDLPRGKHRFLTPKEVSFLQMIG